MNERRKKRPSKEQSPKLRAKVWVEVSKQPAITEAGADLLEQIAACGSVSEAARRLGFSYRRAWLLVDAMNRRWHGALVTKAVGGEHGGGTQLTELGEAILRSFRDLQLQLQHLLDQAEHEFAVATGSIRG